MQQQSAAKCSISTRLHALQLKTQQTWKELAVDLTLSESMVYQLLAEKKNPSKKTVYRLEQLEQHTGIAPVQRSVVQYGQLKEDGPTWSVDGRVQEIRELVAAMGKDVQARIRTIEEKLKELEDQP